MMNGRLPLLIIVFAVCGLLFVAYGRSSAFDETHLNIEKVPGGCSACHRGHGKRATAMLREPKDELCFKCHGAEKKGMKGEAKTDIYSVILKRSNHPVFETSEYHVPGEDLNKVDEGTPRHVSCYDCHNPHTTVEGKSFKGVRGYNGKGLKVKDVSREYLICYNCHSDQPNLPGDSRDISMDFDLSNASYHPIEAVGKNRHVPSLHGNMDESSLIDCSGCHGNNDKFGARGPHGSDYEFLIKGNYTVKQSGESTYAYELCYDCHDRNSILRDESFKAHKKHLISSAPCAACHDAHGSEMFDSLIDLKNEEFIKPNFEDQIWYSGSGLNGRPRCFLSCHLGTYAYVHYVSGENFFCVDTVEPNLLRETSPPVKKEPVDLARARARADGVPEPKKEEEMADPNAPLILNSNCLSMW